MNPAVLIVIVIIVVLVVVLIALYNGLVRSDCGSTRRSPRSKSSSSAATT